MVLILAHRGASADAPENTLEAFRESVSQGSDGVELDAMLCGSGEVVVCHDEQLDRLAGLNWKVAQTPWWKLRQVDVGTRLGFGPARIPLLKEVMDALPSHFVINVELKCQGLDDRGLSGQVAAAVHEAGMAHRVVISSFNFLCLLRIRNHPGLRLGLLVDPERSHWMQSHLLGPLVSTHSIHLPVELCTPKGIEAWRRRHLEVAAWTVDDAATATRLAAMGVKYCITNRPGALKAVLRDPR